jgi:hypothetical protein
VAVQSPEKEEPLGTELWFSFGQPGCFGYFPLFKDSDRIADEFSAAESTDSAWKMAKDLELKVREYGDAKYLTNMLFWRQKMQITRNDVNYVKYISTAAKWESLTEALSDLSYKESVKVKERAKKLLCYL